MTATLQDTNIQAWFSVCSKTQHKIQNKGPARGSVPWPMAQSGTLLLSLVSGTAVELQPHSAH